MNTKQIIEGFRFKEKTTRMELRGSGAHPLNKKVFIFFIIFNCFSFCRFLQSNEYYKEYDKVTEKTVYLYIEKMPIYKNGLSDFHKDIANNINYKDTYQTKIVLEFVIDKKGFLIGERIYNKNLKDLTLFEISCLKSLKNLQNWKPGTINNKKVNVKMKIPIHIDQNIE